MTSSQNDALIAGLSIQLQDLEKRKKSLLDEVNALQLSITRLQAERGRLVNQTACIARLPNEIMSHIFLAGQQGQFHKHALQDKFGDRNKHTPLPFELLVSRITSHWRDIALSTPQLWAYIISWSGTKRHIELNRILTYLARSKSCPIDIDASLEDDEVIALLGDNIPRWRRVYIETICFYDLEKILSLVRHAYTPFLEHISLCPEHHLRVQSTIDRSGFPWDLFTGGAPALSSVRLTGLAIKFAQPPLHTVTTLLLEVLAKDFTIPYARFSDILTAASSLVNLSLWGVSVEAWPTQHPTFKMPALRALRIKSNQSTFFYNLISAIHAPELESLVIADCADEDDVGPSWETVDLSSYTLKFPKLDSLTLIDCYFTYRNCRSLFRKLPTIKHLSLMGSINVDMLRSLGDNCKLSSDMALTRLHTLTLERLETVQESLLCTNVLSGRKQMGYPISVLRLDHGLRSKLRRMKKLDWINQVVCVEKWQQPEPWPPGADSVDIHDLFL